MLAACAIALLALAQAAVPADTVPADTVPADTVPADTVPADTAPADTAPARRAVRMEVGGDVVLRALAAPLPYVAEDGAVAERVGLSVSLRPGVDPADLLERLVRAGAQPVSVALRADGARLDLSLPPALLAPVRNTAAKAAGVLSVVGWSVPELLNDDSIWVGQSYDTINKTTPVFDRGITGTGEVVAVFDSGTDPDMCFFVYSPGAFPPAQATIPPDIGTLSLTTKIRAYYVTPGATAYDGFNGHGTAVSGCVLGDDHLTLSTPADPGHDPADGNAPNATLVMLDGGGSGLSGVVGDLTPIFQMAYDAGARIQNHSWGVQVDLYGPDAADIDRFAWRNEEMLFVNAGGNSGRAPSDQTMVDPAICKNGLAVGATVNGRDPLNARNLAWFTSRGPAFDGRLKPDIVAPGNQQQSAGGTAEIDDDNCRITSNSGTSFAAPTAAGWAALTRQYLREGWLPSGARTADDETRPSAALIRAVMIASAVPIGGTDPTTGLPVDPPPSLNQGYGRPLLDDALYFAGDPHQTTVLDVWNAHGLRTAESAAIEIEVASAWPLEVALVWTDPPVTPTDDPAPLLVNDLDLVVTDPNGEDYLGNVWSGGESVTGGAADRLNNIEAARIAAPLAGTWTVRVDAAAVPGYPGVLDSDRQGFALVVVSPACATSPAAPVLSPPSELPAGIQLDWTAVAGASAYVVYRAEGPSPGAADFRQLTPAPVTATSWLDRDTRCGQTYGYRVRAWDRCRLSPLSSVQSIDRTTGSCDLAPDFAGLRDAAPTGQCGEVVLSWDAATSRCSCSTGVVYNVWASTTLPIDPSTPPLASCIAGTQLTLDLGAAAGATHFLVRAEDRVPGGPGRCGGREEGNLTTLASVPTSPGRRVRFGDNFEAGRGRWTRRLLFGTHAWDILPEPFAATPDSALIATEAGAATDSTAELRTPLAATADTLVGFAHTYQLEGRWDGGVVEYSTDGGTQWWDAGSRLVKRRYDDWLMTGVDNDVLRPGFTGGTLAPMTETLIWLGDLAGETVSLRFRMLTDSGGRRERWAVDDFMVFERDCPQTPGAPVAAFTHTAPVCVGDAIALDAAPTWGGNPPYTYSWDFGDGSPADTRPAPAHTYATAGTYSVTLTVSDNGAQADTVSMPVEVVDEVAAPDLGNTLRLTHDGVSVVLQWSEPPGEWPAAEVWSATRRDLGDLAFDARIPWDQPRTWLRPGGLSEPPALRLFRARLLSTCRGLPGP